MALSVTIKVNNSEIDRKVRNNRTLQRKGLNAAQVKLEKQLRLAKNLLLQEFDGHPVTQEIEAGPFTNNKSGSLGGYGNLFSFIGFDYGEDPTSPVRELIRESIFLNRGTVTTRGWSFKVNLPTKIAIRAVSPIPWESGSSWVEGVEEGSISGLKYYVVQRGQGHSLGGYQDDEVANNLVMSRTAYLTQMLDDFRQRIRNIRN